MTELSKKSLLLVKICNILLAEEMDNIKSTAAYKQDIKHLVNRLSEKLEKEYNETYKLYYEDETSQLGFQYAVGIIESFVEKVSSLNSTEELIVFNEKLKTI